MVQILKQNSLGELLGEGLSTGIKNLADYKVNEMLQRQSQRTGSQFWKSLGLPDNLAMSFASADPTLQKELLQRLEGLNIMPQSQPLSGLRALEKLQQPEYVSQLSPQAKEMFGQGPQVPSLQELLGSRQPQQLPQQEQGGLRIGPNPADRRHREVLEQQAQIHSEKLAAPVLKQIEERAIPARKVTNAAREALDILKTGKVITGLGGKITPNYLQTAEGQEFLTKINDIVLQKAQIGKGVPSRLRLQLEQLSKPDVWQKPKAIEKLLNDLIYDPEMQREVAMDQAREEILEENNGIAPRNYKSLIEKRGREIAAKNVAKRYMFNELPDASLYKDKIARNAETGERMKSNGVSWQPIEE